MSKSCVIEAYPDYEWFRATFGVHGIPICGRGVRELWNLPDSKSISKIWFRITPGRVRPHKEAIKFKCIWQVDSSGVDLRPVRYGMPIYISCFEWDGLAELLKMTPDRLRDFSHFWITLYYEECEP